MPAQVPSATNGQNNGSEEESMTKVKNYKQPRPKTALIFDHVSIWLNFEDTSLTSQETALGLK